MTDDSTTDTATPVEDVTEATTAAQDAPVEQADKVDTFSADYVAQLRAEAAEYRVRAKIADEANAHLLTAYAEADGRLAASDVLPLSDDLLGEDGLVDRDKVRAAIGDLLTAKPYLQSRRPTTALPMGAQPLATPDVGWLSVLRGQTR